jgi:hypothetical protein
MTYPTCGNLDMAMYCYGDGFGTWHVECDECQYLGPGDNKILAIRRHNERCVAHQPENPT